METSENEDETTEMCENQTVFHNLKEYTTVTKQLDLVGPPILDAQDPIPSSSYEGDIDNICQGKYIVIQFKLIQIIYINYHKYF